MCSHGVSLATSLLWSRSVPTAQKKLDRRGAGAGRRASDRETRDFVAISRELAQIRRVLEMLANAIHALTMVHHKV